MKKWCLVILTLSFIYPLFSMTIDNLLQHKDIEPLIINQMHKEDLMDMRLVCKKWALRATDGKIMPTWQLMPDNIEQRYDSIIKSKKLKLKLGKKIILLDLINDSKAVQWIVDRPIGFNIKLRSHYLKNPLIWHPHLLSIHYHQPEITRLLIEKNEDYKDQCWKTIYRKTAVSQEIRDCWYINNDQDFSFILSVITIVLDHVETFKFLYKKKRLTELGAKILLEKCIQYRSFDCLDMLFKRKEIKYLMSENNIYFFQLALQTESGYIIKKFLTKKIFPLNGSLDPHKHETILDYYDNHPEIPNQGKIIEILLSLNAKKGKDVKNE